MELDASSLERLVPDQLSDDDVTGKEALRIGVERYAFAARYVRPGRALDCACGAGLGTRLIADVEGDGRPETVLGVDLSAPAIDYARDRYADARTTFRCADAMHFDDTEGFDTIVSIETIEHLPDPVGFVARLAELLRPGGVLVASVPITPSVDANPHHLHDFTSRSFRALFAPHDLIELDSLTQEQPFSVVAVATRSEERLQDMRPNLMRWYASHPGALLRRVTSTLRHGFKNRYLTIAWQRAA